ncbi:MAG: hypothetical protein D6728_09475, partial [Cyanobacteria bacterium J055]
SGDVTIHPGAAIAPGVILQAAPNSRITIADGVCIGIGAVLNAYDGTISIESGATLGAGVLIVGGGTVGTRACVGAATTIFNQSIAPWQVVPAGSLIGDSSRHPDGEEAATSNGDRHSAGNCVTDAGELDDYWQTPTEDAPAVSDVPLEGAAVATREVATGEAEASGTDSRGGNTPKGSRLRDREAANDNAQAQKPAEPQKEKAKAAGEEETPVYGQVYVNRILYTIFPQGRSPNSSS